MAALKNGKEVTNLFTFYAANYPQIELIINNDVAMQKGVSIKAAMDSLNILIGSTWEQGFIRFNQFYKVFVQARSEYRRYPEDLDNLFVKNDKGDMVPYSAFMTIKKKLGLNEITRYNLYTSAAIQCAPAAGYSTGQAIQAIKEVGAEKLPRGFDIGWSGLAYDEARKGNEAIYIFLIVVAFVYLVLVGQYESFILPLAVILSLPVGLFGSFFFLQAMGLANDVYAQIGLVMLVGLLGKNAILIVEFAVQRRLEGVSLKDAAVEGAKLRFRPIQMTSFAFIAGLLPLVVATGAGAIGNRTIGTTGAGGMLVGTVIGVLVIPGLYYLFGQLDGGRKLLKDETHTPLSERFEHARRMNHLVRFPDSEQKKKNASTFTCSILLVLPSCGIPDLRRADPGPDPPGGFKGATRSENSSQVGIEEFFDDPMLTSLIDRALAGNRELKIPAQDLQIAGDEIPARRGAYLPFVTIGRRGAQQTRPLHARGSRRGTRSNKLDRTLSRTTMQLLQSANCALIHALFDGSWQRMSDKPTIQTVGKVEIRCQPVRVLAAWILSLTPDPGPE